MDKTELHDKLLKYAEAKGYHLNPDPKFLDYLLNALLRNLENKGELYCPCRLDKVADNICPCVFCDDDVEATGHCHCHLFFK